MDKEQIVHDLTMACLTVVKSSSTGHVIVSSTVDDYINKSATIRKLLEENQE